MTLREAMLTLNGEEDNAQVHMDRMKERLVRLKQERDYIIAMRCTDWILDDVETDIRHQQAAIDRARRINPNLV